MPAPPPVVLKPVPAVGAPTVPVPPVPKSEAPVAPPPAVPASPAEAPPVEASPSPDAGGATPPRKVSASETPKVDPIEALGKNKLLGLMLKDEAVTVKPEVFERLPMEGQELVAGLLKSFDAAVTKLRAEMAQVEEASRAAVKDRASAARDRADALQWLKDEGLLQAIEDAKLKPGERPDPLSEDGVARLAQDRAADALKTMLEKIGEGAQKREEAAKAAEAEAAHAARRAEALEYMKQFPGDFADPELFAAIKSRTQLGMSIKQAHQDAVARRTLADLEAKKSADLEESRARLARAPQSEAPIPEMPESYRGDSAKELAFYKRYPQAAARDIARARAQRS